MRDEDLSGELRKFSPTEAAPIRRLGDLLHQGQTPGPEAFTDAIFALEQLESLYPAYGRVYRGLLEGIEARFEHTAMTANPGRFCDEVQNPATAEPPSQEKLAEPPAGEIPVKGQEQAKLDAGAKFELHDCDHGEVPDPGHEQDILLEDQGPVPPPSVIYADTFNLEEKAPPWTDERWMAVESQMEALSFATNPPKAAKELLPEEWLAKGMLPTYLLGSNPKMAEGSDRCWLSAGLSLAPWTVAGVPNLCPFASKGCSTSCLAVSGQAEATLKHATAGRVKRTKLLFTPETRPAFAAWIEQEVGYWMDLTSRDSAKWPAGFRKALGWREGDVCSGKYRLGLRMNVLSDIRWDGMPLPWADSKKQTMMTRFPDLQFYDYTKNPHRMTALLEGRFPKNYYLTFSWSEINADFAFHVLDRGGCVAMAFDTRKKSSKRAADALPSEFCGYPVIDADTHDFRFLDREDHADLIKSYGTGVICGLRLKGNKHRREFEENKALELKEGKPRGWYTGGFCQYSEDCGMVQGKQVGENLTNRPDYKAMLISEAKRKREEQGKETYMVGGRKVTGYHAVPKSWGA